MNGTSFAWTSWFLVKVHIKVNSHRITLFEHFWILKWRNRPQNQNLLEKLSQTSPFWKFWLSVKIYAKVNFLEIDYLCNFQVLMYLKNWVGQVHFENFDFLVKVIHGQGLYLFRFVFCFLFFFFFFCTLFGSRSVWMGQTGSDLDRWVKPVKDDIIPLKLRVRV